MSRLRVGIDYRPALLGHTGIGRYVRQLVEALPEVMGEIDLALFAAFWKGIGPRVLPNQVVGAELFAPRFPGRLLQVLGRMKVMAAETFTGPVDLFQATDFVELPIRSPNRIATIYDLGFLREPSWYSSTNQRRLESVTKQLVARSTSFITVSEASRVDLIERFAVDPNLVSATLLGASREFFDVPSPPVGAPQILMVGTLEPRKNHARLLCAFEKVSARHPDSRLVIVGRRGWLDEDVVSQINRLESLGIVVWHRDANEDDLMAAMAECSIVAYPSLWEGFGLPVVEGMAAGRAVLTANVGATAEVAGDAACLVDPTNTEEIADALDFLLSDASVRESLGARGKARANELSWRRCAEATVAVWRQASEREVS